MNLFPDVECRMEEFFWTSHCCRMVFGFGDFCIQLDDSVWKFGRNLELMCCTLEPHREQPCLTYQILLDR